MNRSDSCRAVYGSNALRLNALVFMLSILFDLVIGCCYLNGLLFILFIPSDVVMGCCHSDRLLFILSMQSDDMI